MGIGTSVFLIAVGAIFEYALPHSLGVSVSDRSGRS